jgi:hypothetical protein
MRHFSEAAQLLAGRQAAVQLDSVQALGKASLGLLADPEGRRAMGQRAGQALAERAGASRKTAQLAAKLLMITDMKTHGEDWRAESLRREATPREFGDSPEGFSTHDY